MHVNRQFLDVKQQRVVIELPSHFINRRVEIIALAENDAEANLPKNRKPHSAIAGKGRTLGDLVSPIIDEVDWECLK